ncbi:MAG: hypothetical protein DRH08_15390 [Deltaproteobacteria bacterium]|nr:MAG: hypothetical protein DRH08_15390 [Deltaproteobacteria bacterium]
MKKLLILAVGLLALTIPALASANHVTSVTGNADCDGWSICPTVYFLPNAVDGSLCYSVTLLDADYTVVTTITATETIIPPDGGGSAEYCFDGLWEGNFVITGGTVVFAAALNGDNPTVFLFDLECTVANENISFDSIKSIYR